eukprot:109293_1
MATNKKPFCKTLRVYLQNNKLFGALQQLYKVIKDCDLTDVRCIPKVGDDDMKLDEDEDDYHDVASTCPALQRVKMILGHFEAWTDELFRSDEDRMYRHNIQSYLFFSRYPASEFLNDMDHIDRHKLNHPRIQSCSSARCPHIQRTITRTGNVFAQSKSLQVKKEYFNTNFPSDFRYISMLDQAHSRLMHSHDETTQIKTKVMMNTDHVSTDSPLYNTGVYMEYHTLKPLYQNLFGEIVRNPNCEIDKDQCDSELEESKMFCQTDKLDDWSACKTDLKHAIKVNEPMHIEHILCLKVYCNYSNHCEQFRRSYRKMGVDDTDDDVIRRHCDNYYWFGRFVTAAVEFWGDIPQKDDEFYHGLSTKFVFRDFSTVYEIPTSTTWDFSVAQKFCNSNGIVLKLAPKFTDDVNHSRCLDVSPLSQFADDEKEQLIFAGMTVLSITNIYNPSHNGWTGYADYVQSFLYFERIIQQTIHQKHHYNFGKISKEKQREYLVPLIRYQMKQNGYSGLDGDIEFGEDLAYICVLFGYFCDSKRDHIDLSCINEEIP